MRIIIEFVGGCLDGNRMEGSAYGTGDIESIDYAAAYFQLTNGGEPGQRFWVISDSTRDALSEPFPYPAVASPLVCRRHYYEIVGREDQDHHVILRVRFVGSVQPAQEARN